MSKNYSIFTQHHIDNSVIDFNSGVGRGFPDSLVSAIVISTAVVSPSLCYIQFISCIFLLLNFISDADVNFLPSPIGDKLLGELWL